MGIIRHEIEARCPPQRIWALLARLEAVAEYNPGVRAARLRSGAATGPGAERECDLLPSGRVVERVTVWEEGRALGLEVIESDWPIHFMRWVTRVEPRPGGSLLTQDLEYAMKFGPLGGLLDRLVVRRKLTATLDGVLAALVARAENLSTPVVGEGRPPSPA
jgi:hypothetical protein